MRTIPVVLFAILTVSFGACGSSSGSSAGGVSSTTDSGSLSDGKAGLGDTTSSNVDTLASGNETAGTDWAYASVVGKKVTLSENPPGPSNVWEFTSATVAKGVTLGMDAPYTWEKKGGTSAVLIFDVQGKDRYDLVFTAAGKGTLQESFNGQAGNAGTFVFE
ncbi:MAG: hypothetical protein HY902_14325 [Deltaproteobacteria bacterium]|nr:hypothetical protein [Deltaproteobacteria bacterium]